MDKCLEFIDENGDREGDITVKTDQEPAVEFLIKELVDQRAEGRTHIEEAPKKSSGSNWGSRAGGPGD